MERNCVSVAEGYERWAPNYDRDPNPLLALEARHLSPLLLRRKGKRLLDLACGTGRWLSWLVPDGVDSGVGLDFSPAMLAAAKGRPGTSGRLVKAGCCAIPFANGAFDVAVCSFAVGHIADLQGVAREVGRVTAATSDVYVSDLHPEAYSLGWRTRFRDSRGSVEIATCPRSAREFLAPWISAGFNCCQVVECRFGEPERCLFNEAGKGREFEGFCKLPAVLICHFRRRP